MRRAVDVELVKGVAQLLLLVQLARVHLGSSGVRGRVISGLGGYRGISLMLVALVACSDAPPCHGVPSPLPQNVRYPRGAEVWPRFVAEGQRGRVQSRCCSAEELFAPSQR